MAGEERLYLDGWSLHLLAVCYGRDDKTVWRYLRSASSACLARGRSEFSVAFIQRHLFFPQTLTGRVHIQA
jgi:hypothetical protein